MRSTSLLAVFALAQQSGALPLDVPAGEIVSDGWRGFYDYAFILSSLGALVLASALGALIAFHPMTLRLVDTLDEAELPKIYIMYAVVGAVIGVTVREYGMVVGLVVFGIGGLIRFRTEMKSTPNTARLIIVTLIGLSCGLGLPHFAVLTALFAFALIYLLDARPIYRIVIKDIPIAGLPAAANAYRNALRSAKCQLISERTIYSKQHVTFVVRAPWKSTQDALQGHLDAEVASEVRGHLNWEVE